MPAPYAAAAAVGSHALTAVGAHRVNGRVGVDLQGVDVVPGVLEEPVVGVEHLMAEEVDPLPSNATVVQPILPTELDQHLLLEVTHSHLHDLPVGLLKDVLTRRLNATVAGLRLHSAQLRTQGLHLVHQVSLGAWGRRRGIPTGRRAVHRQQPAGHVCWETGVCRREGHTMTRITMTATE